MAGRAVMRAPFHDVSLSAAVIGLPSEDIVKGISEGCLRFRDRGTIGFPFREQVAPRHLAQRTKPHTFLNGATPDERYFGRGPPTARHASSTRPRWPRGSPCARPQTLIKGQPGVRLELVVAFEAGQKHLPVVELRRVA